MEPRLTVLTLGCDDVDRAARFYERLGWHRPGASSTGSLVYFRLGELTLALYPRAELFALTGALGSPRPGHGDTLLSHNVEREPEVETILAAAERAGGRVTRAASPAPWGGTHGFFADPEGHAWEVCFNPKWSKPG